MVSKHFLPAVVVTSAMLSLSAVAANGPGAPGGNGGGGTVPVPAPFDTLHFSSAETCALCHNGLTDQAGQDVSLERDWGAGMMAHASRDPLWQAKVASERARAPQLAEVIDAKCSRCHMPMANVELTDSGDPIAILDGPADADGLLDPLHPLHAVAIEGVSCTLCHQIEDDGNLGLLEGFSGHYSIADHDVPAERTIYGPVPNPRINPMRNQAGFTPTYALHASDSALCAACHNLKTPFVDDDGNLASTDPESEFAEQMPYTEWEHSDFAPNGATPRTCQSCHMPETDGVKLSNRPPWLTPVDAFSRHRFAGANTTMLDILNRNRSALGVTSTGLAGAIADARAMLADAAELALIDADVDDSGISVVVEVINHSGHKLPTSFPSRRVWLHVKVTDQAGKVVFESGKLGNDGRIAGANGDSDPASYEPHHQQITSADQVQIYEPVMGDTDGSVTHTLLRAGSYLKDNRLTPAGLHKASAPSDAQVMGLAANDTDFDNGADRVTYRIPVGGAEGPFTVAVELNYQVLSWPFLRDLFQDDALPEVARFRALYEDQPILAETIDTLQTTVSR
ncbi:MAG: cytochrome c family protein [Thiohalocapsa sp.]|uniref:hypothetical protein n=1 Tax=Thiohalocapsa sp. TaxID=2497641 RepID=UPI0025E28FE3|nr:hypothetical protein [Thiohalocapsa sp.]MCG6940230.1 cytochrome c family protein [Thiohalocapsa sp.]